MLFCKLLASFSSVEYINYKFLNLIIISIVQISDCYLAFDHKDCLFEMKMRNQNISLTINSFIGNSSECLRKLI